MSKTQPAVTNISVNAGTLARYDAHRTFIIGPNVGTALAQIRAVAATGEQLIKHKWQVLFQPEGDGEGAAFQPKAPFTVLTSDRAIIFYSQRAYPTIIQDLA